MPPKKRKASAVERAYGAGSLSQASALRKEVDRENSNRADQGDEREANTVGVPDENPWTQREELEILRIYRDHNDTERKQKAEMLHNLMSRIRHSRYEQPKPARSGAEVTSKVRELNNSGVTIQSLEAKLYPPSSAPRPAKRKKKETKDKYDPDQEYRAKEILEENATHFKISWEDDEESGEQFAATWEPKKHANRWLLEDWEERKRQHAADG